MILRKYITSFPVNSWGISITNKNYFRFLTDKITYKPIEIVGKKWGFTSGGK